ncbi:MAG: efflux RND transporter permease subunit [bacterium]|nr:cobalt-zinc-cadmium resistance protein [Deltaproteobacteria bacterium]MCP4904714.1 efflux RND transporter permease subunit [bacterium]
MTSAIAWFVRNPVAANLMMMVMVVGGVLTLGTLRQEEFPPVEPEAVQIVVEYRGASPAEIEASICIRIEEAVEGTPDLDRITTFAAEGVCNVTAELIVGADVTAAATEIENRIDAIDTFPVESERPLIAKVETKRPILKVAISGPIDEPDLKRLGQLARDEIAGLNGVSQAVLKYDRPFEISIEVSEDTLRRHGIDLEHVARAVREFSLDLPGGSVKTAGGEILLRTKGQAYRGVDFEDIVVITENDGTLVRLGEIAEVIDGFEDTDLRGLFNGDPSVVIKVQLIGEEDALVAAAAVKEWIHSFRASLPAGVDATIFNDDSLELVVRLDVLVRNGRTGLALVLVVLALFLRFRLAMWVAAGVPIAFAGALFMFPFFDLTISTLTVIAFIIVLGILVDDAIVIGESVHSKEVEGLSQIDAAIQGTQAVFVPVIFGVLTSVTAFLPIMILPGQMGGFFGTIGKTAIICLVFSLFEALLILPSHLAHRKRSDSEGGSNRVSSAWRRFQSGLAGGLDRLAFIRYASVLERAIEFRYATLALAIGMMILTGSMVTTGRLRYQFFPEIAGDIAYATITMPRGIPLGRTELAVAQLQGAAEELIRQLDEEIPGPSIVVHTFASIGEQLGRPVPEEMGPSGSGGHLGEVGIELVSALDRDITTDEVLNRWRDLAGPVTDAVKLEFSSDAFGAGEAIEIELYGTDSIEELTLAADAIKRNLASYAGVIDIADSFRAGKQEVQLSVRDSAVPLGLTQNDLARQVRQAFYGEEAQRIQRGRDDVRIMVRYPEEERRSLGSLEEMRIRTKEGIAVPFSAVARAEISRGFASIRRTDRERVVTVTASVNRGLTTPAIILEEFEAWLPEFHAQFPNVDHRYGGEQREQSTTTSGIVTGTLMALLIIYVLLAIPLGSYAQPLIIMSVIPFGTVGALLGHKLMGWDVVFFSILGIVALAGVVVNASLVMVHTINRRREEGLSLGESVRTAATTRFRPIVLTTATTFLGLVPLMFEAAVPAAPLIPMAIALAYGVLYASVMTLFLVPIGYHVVDDLDRLWSRAMTKRKTIASSSRGVPPVAGP